jgi:outer membrane protein assembly factor BamD
LDQTYTHKAIEALQLFVNLFPESPRVPDANARIDEMWHKLEVKDLNSAMLYYNRGQYKAAATCFANLLEDFPVSDNGEQVQYMRVKSLFLLAENSTERRQAERYHDTVLACEEFLTAFPGTKRAEDVLDMKSKSEQFSNRQLP